nr:ABC transporter ATP-binding protein [Candidatus Sigynarchaeota archaeon]
MSTKPIVRLDHVTKIYGKARLAITAVNDVSLEIMPGEAITIMGPSGSGKSTLLHLLGAMDTPTSGTVEVDGKDISHLPETKLAKFRRFSIGFIFQSFYLLPNIDVIDNVLAPTIPYKLPRIDYRVQALELLEAVGLENRAYSKVRELSGGQSQRVAIARALINDPKVILADEPTGNLDSVNGKGIIDLLLKFVDKGKTIIIVTHDPRIGAAIAGNPKGRNIWMQDGKLNNKPTYDQYCWDASADRSPMASNP